MSLFKFILIFLSTFIVGSYFIHARFVKNLFQQQAKFDFSAGYKEKYIPLPLLHSVGAFSFDSRRRYLNQVEKSSGVIRIGVFGESLSYGAEVSPGLDFPSLLEKKFHNNGMQNIQVLNFASMAHGFHQAYRIWEQWGKQYHLDFILLGPNCFLPTRDSTFNSFVDGGPYFLHGRYILKHGNLEFLDVIGDPNVNSRMDNYFRFVPAFRYLRHDRNPPSLLMALTGFPRFHISNPFYYTSLTKEDEQLPIYVQMLLNMAKNSSVFLLNGNPNWNSIESQIRGSVFFAPYELSGDFPYKREMHPSAMGNDRLAQVFFDALMGKEKSVLKRIKLSWNSLTHASAAVSPNGGVHLEIGGQEFARLISRERRFSSPYSLDFISAQINGSQVKALLVLADPDTSIFEYAFFPLTHRPNSDESLQLIATNGAKVDTVQLAQLASLIPIFVANIPGLFPSWSPYGATNIGNRIAMDGLKTNIGEIKIGSDSILKRVSSTDSLWKMTDDKQVPLYLKPQSATYIASDHLPKSGPVNMKFDTGSNATIGSFSMEDESIPLPKAHSHICQVANSSVAKICDSKGF